MNSLEIAKSHTHTIDQSTFKYAIEINLLTENYTPNQRQTYQPDGY